MKKYPKVSIIIPLYKKTPYFYESVEKCLELDYPNFEVLIGVDRFTTVTEFKDSRIRILKTEEEKTGPAEKRDLCLQKAKGDVIAFLDDDSFPESDWLTRSVGLLKKMKVSAVCGPGLTPPLDGFAQRVTGSILASLFGSGPYFYRFIKGSPRFVDDYPAYNMIVTMDVLKKVGGWGTKFYGGEDTALCLKLINNGERIYYHPEIVVYHHRRAFPQGYAKQVANVGLHRGYFVKAYPQTSLRLTYFGPAVFTLALPFAIVLSFSSLIIAKLFLLALIIFASIVVFESRHRNSVAVNLILPLAVIFNYVVYGINFMKGLLFTKKLVR